MNKKYIVFTIAIFIIIVVGIVWRRASAPKYSGPVDKVTLQLKWLHQAQFAGFYVAAQEGFYKEEGLDVSIFPVGADHSEKGVIDRVAQGDIQFGVVGADQVILARAANKPVKAISVIFQKSPVVLATLRSSGIKTLKDLIGKRMAVDKGQNTEVIYRAMMKRAGVDMAKVREVSVPPGAESLIKGVVDARMVYLINEGIEAKEKGYALNYIYPDEYSLQFYADTIIASDTLIKQNPDLVRRFVRASLKGWNWAVAYPNEAAVLALRYDPKLVASHEIKMMQMSLPFIYTSQTSIGGMDSGTWKNMEEILSPHSGSIGAPAPLENIFTTEFLQL